MISRRVLSVPLALIAVVALAAAALPRRQPSAPAAVGVANGSLFQSLAQGAVFGPAVIDSTGPQDVLAQNTLASTATWYVTIHNFGDHPVTIDRGGIASDSFTVEPGESEGKVYEVAQHQAIRWTPGGPATRFSWVIR
jgi:hypothetical protein